MSNKIKKNKLEMTLEGVNHFKFFRDFLKNKAKTLEDIWSTAQCIFTIDKIQIEA